MNNRNAIAACALCLAAIAVTAPDLRAATATTRPATIAVADTPDTPDEGKNTGQYRITHGPYLQGLTYDGVTVAFTTSD